MPIADIIKKIQEVEGLNLSEEEIAELQKPIEDTKTIDSLKNEKAAKARILEEKKKAVSRMAELEAELDTLKDKDLDEAEKSKKTIEKFTKDNADKDEALKIANSTLEKTVKAYNLEKIASGIKFLETIPKDLKILAIEKGFGSIDLSDETALKTAKESFTETYKGILATETAATGSGATSGSGVIKTTDPSKMSMDERAKQLRNL